MNANQNYAYVRPTKAKYLQTSRMLSQYREALSYEVHSNAVILPVRLGSKSSLDFGGVVDTNGDYIISSVIPGWVSGVYDDYQENYSNKTAVYLGRMIGHWGHFLLETITRLWYFIEHDDPSYIYVFIVREGTIPPIEGNFKQFFDLLGISNRLVFLNQATRYRSVIIPERSFQYKKFNSPHYNRIIDCVIQNALASTQIVNPCRRVFLSRSKFKRACDVEVGLDMLDHFFEANQYQVLYPETMSLAELIVRLQAADECASESGTAAHNFLFCKTGQQTIVMERQAVVNNAQISIDCVRSLRTTYVDSHLSVHPICTGAGPFFLYYTTWMARLTTDLNYLPPNPYFFSRIYIEKCLCEYEAKFRQIHDESNTRSDDNRLHEEYIEEACRETVQFLQMHGFHPTLT